jgi:membrane protein required for beta-lactamase induction
MKKKAAQNAASMAIGLYLLKKENFHPDKRTYLGLNFWSNLRKFLAWFALLGLIIAMYFLLNAYTGEQKTTRTQLDAMDKVQPRGR